MKRYGRFLKFEALFRPQTSGCLALAFLQNQKAALHRTRQQKPQPRTSSLPPPPPRAAQGAKHEEGQRAAEHRDPGDGGPQGLRLSGRRSNSAPSNDLRPSSTNLFRLQLVERPTWLRPTNSLLALQRPTTTQRNWFVSNLGPFY